MNVEHDYKNREERRKVCKWIDKNLGLDFEVTEDDDGLEGTILVFDVEPEEFHEMMDFLKDGGLLNE